MTNRNKILLVVSLFAGTAIVPACYTIVYHPRLANLDYDRPDSKRCADCHTGDEIWSFNHGPTAPDYRDYANTWADFYDSPWWYVRYWNYEPQSDPASDPHARKTSTQTFTKGIQCVFDRTEGSHRRGAPE